MIYLNIIGRFNGGNENSMISLSVLTHWLRLKLMSLMMNVNEKECGEKQLMINGIILKKI